MLRTRKDKKGFSLRSLVLPAGPACFLLIHSLPGPDPESPLLMTMAGILVWIALWWLTEIVHLAVTSLLPILLLPFFGISSLKDTAAQYMEPVIFLFLGGFMLAYALEKQDLHRRLALRVLGICGKNTAWILAGLMISTYLVSMWVSNTATVMMLFPAIGTICAQVSSNITVESEKRKMQSAFFLSLAYSASIGGMATLVGTPTNMIFINSYMQNFPEDTQINFGSWFAIAGPVSLILLVGTFMVLFYSLPQKLRSIKTNRLDFHAAYKQHGKLNRDQLITAGIFLLTALLWLSRSPVDTGTLRFPGWSSLLEHPDRLQDAGVALAMALLLFFIPSQTQSGKHLLEWEDVRRFPMEVLLLFGCGFSLALGFEESGLSNWMGQKLVHLGSLHTLLLLILICTVVCLLSEIASNVATIQLILPLLLSLSASSGIPAHALMIPATLAASLGFMLPVATAPNTIVYSSGVIRVPEMMLAGFKIDTFGILIISLISWLFLF